MRRQSIGMLAAQAMLAFPTYYMDDMPDAPRTKRPKKPNYGYLKGAWAGDGTVGRVTRQQRESKIRQR